MKILIAGGTGQVGRQILERLDPEQHEVVALVRKHGSIPPKSNQTEKLFNFDNETIYESLFEEVKPDLLVIALGTTRKKAGNLKNFLKVDRDIPIRLIQIYQKISHSPKRIIFISSVGADKPMGTYLRAKFDVESEIFRSGIPYIIARPSLLISKREESRPLEELSGKVLGPSFQVLRKLFPHFQSIQKYSPVPVQTVAKKVLGALSQNSLKLILEGF